MISAIAARKAAQAAQQKTRQPTPPQGNSPLSKRKSSPQSTSTSTFSKRQKRAAHKQSDNLTPSFGVSKVIVIDSDDSDNDNSTNIAVEAHGISKESGEGNEVALPPHLTARPWSPSVPLHDLSSEDEEADVSDLIDLPPRLRSGEKVKSGTILSTFSPTPGKNVFFLSTVELKELGLDLKEKGTLVALDEGDRLCLLGTCRVTVLGGSISVNGVVLRPSINPHNIFAPRSSPLPVVEYDSSSTNATLDGFCPPQSLQSRDPTELAIILLQELKTNVETLGNICRTFGGIYELPGARWENDFAIDPFHINGLHLVCPLVSLYSFLI